jgi:Ni/Co efflux regulator RcnB
MSTRSLLAVVLVTFLGLAFGRAAQSNSSQPQQQHEHPIAEDKGSHGDQKHYEDVNKHGDMAMGFSHMQTTHHFRLTATGGFIQVQANDPKDITSRDQIRAHLQHISKAFKDGNFSAPEMTHSRVPPGVSTMQQLKSDIEYRYAETNTGAKVVISTANPEALKAVHKFLRFQIEDHRTGDPTAIRK